MLKVDTAKLITTTPTQRGTFDAETETLREVYVEVKSATRAEAYAMLSNGMSPSYVLKLALAEDYCNEQELVFRNERYRVVRAYETADGGVELTLERIGVYNV